MEGTFCLRVFRVQGLGDRGFGVLGFRVQGS